MLKTKEDLEIFCEDLYIFFNDDTRILISGIGFILSLIISIINSSIYPLLIVNLILCVYNLFYYCTDYYYKTYCIGTRIGINVLIIIIITALITL